VKGGSPSDREKFLSLAEDGFTVWVPKDMQFRDNVVRLDVKREFLRSTLTIDTAVLDFGSC
jgi:hypothetical protein